MIVVDCASGPPALTACCAGAASLWSLHGSYFFDMGLLPDSRAGAGGGAALGLGPSRAGADTALCLFPFSMRARELFDKTSVAVQSRRRMAAHNSEHVGWSEAHYGYCGVTPHDLSAVDRQRMCTELDSGSWKLGDLASCFRHCERCERCIAVSYSTQFDDCSWFSSCAEPAALWKKIPTFRTAYRLGVPVPPPLYRPFAWLPDGWNCKQSAVGIYVYDFDRAWGPNTPWGQNGPATPISWREPFGPPVDKWNTAATADYLGALLARVLFHRTADPANASLFYIPHPTDDARWCSDPVSMLHNQWSGHPVDYFARRGGKDHFTAFHWGEQLGGDGGGGYGVNCGRIKNSARSGWLSAAVDNVTKLVGALRSPWERRRSTTELQATYGGAGALSRILEVPYGGSVAHPRFWSKVAPRPVLVTASFKSGKHQHKNHFQQMDLRATLGKQCRAAANKSVCSFISLGEHSDLVGQADGRTRLLTVLGAMRRATFSLQPAGDDPARKSIIDSVTSGCIPVLFYPEQRELWPAHWGSWINSSTVYIPHSDVLSGQVDVLQTLRAIPEQQVQMMQLAIERNARRLVYGVGPGAAGGADAFDVALHRVLRNARDHSSDSTTHRSLSRQCTVGRRVVLTDSKKLSIRGG